MRKLRKFKAAGLFGVVVLTGVFFQNCSKGYQASKIAASTSSSSGSTQCKAEFVAKVLAEKLPASELRCGEAASYACERRVFRPNVASGTAHEVTCVGADCVEVDVRTYDTAGVTAGSLPAQFEPGGDYNREEVHCYNRLQRRDVVVIEAEGDSLADVFAKTKSACEAAVGGV